MNIPGMSITEEQLKAMEKRELDNYKKWLKDWEKRMAFSRVQPASWGEFKVKDPQEIRGEVLDTINTAMAFPNPFTLTYPIPTSGTGTANGTGFNITLHSGFLRPSPNPSGYASMIGDWAHDGVEGWFGVLSPRQEWCTTVVTANPLAATKLTCFQRIEDAKAYLVAGFGVNAAQNGYVVAMVGPAPNFAPVLFSTVTPGHAGIKPATPLSTKRNEAACVSCNRMNDIGVKTCYWCGNAPHVK